MLPIRAALAGILLLVLAGCAEGTSIYHNRTLSPAGDRVITLDAKQRNLLVTRDTEGQWRMCAEAAPDVFSALSASASLDADITTRSGRAAAAVAEAAGSIERTQTVNLLRESMYRTCERYLSGSIGRAQLVVQAARDQRAMVKILAIEQLTRVARAPATIVVAPSTSASTVDGGAAADLVKSLGKERTDAKATLDAAAATYAAALKTGKCDTVATAPADDTGDPKLTDWTACKAAGVARDARQKAYDDATGRFDKALAATAQRVSQSSAATGAGTPIAGGGTGAPSDAALQGVAAAVERIANAPDIDEALMFCIAYLEPGARSGAAPPDAATTSMCQETVRRRAEQDEQLRPMLLDAGGNRYTFRDFTTTTGSSILSAYNRYITNPRGGGAAGSTERKRRIALAQAAARTVGLPHSPQDIAALATGDPAEVSRVVTVLRTLETNATALADLGS